MMLRWRIWFTARASAMNRETASGSGEAPVQDLDGDPLADQRVLARIDVAERPEPIFRSMRYSPTIMPGSRASSFREKIGRHERRVVRRAYAHVVLVAFAALRTHTHTERDLTGHRRSLATPSMHPRENRPCAVRRRWGPRKHACRAPPTRHDARTFQA